MARHKAPVEDVKNALRAGMKTGYEMGFDAAIDLVRRFQESFGEEGDMYLAELKKCRDHVLAKSLAVMDEVSR